MAFEGASGVHAPVASASDVVASNVGGFLFLLCKYIQ
jgi:hypothetical protein